MESKERRLVHSDNTGKRNKRDLRTTGLSLEVLTYGSSLDRWQQVRVNKQSWSRCISSPCYSSYCSVSRLSTKGIWRSSELCEISFWVKCLLFPAPELQSFPCLSIEFLGNFKFFNSMLAHYGKDTYICL